MTFYWWSHWFWITAMSNLLLFHLIVVVHTYPSQDSSSQEFNRHQTDNTKKLVTKLYQTSTISWSTEPSVVARTTAVEKTILQSVTKSEESHAPSTTTPPPSPPPQQQQEQSSSTYAGVTEKKHLTEFDGFEEYYYDQEDENPTKQIGLVEMEEDIENNAGLRPKFVPDEKENDIKRSAEHFSKSSDTEMKQITDLSPKELSSSISSSSSLLTPLEDKNNYTNFTDKNFNSTNATARNTSLNNNNNNNNDNVMNTTPPTASSTFKISDNNSDTLMAASSASASSSSVIAFESSGSSSGPVVSTLTSSNNNNNVTLSPHAPPSTPKIVGAHHHASLDWLNSMADVAVSPPTARATTDTNDERFPFTLENAHKPEDLRRDESEPRTRKSKGLSAEYKHGYASINYSSETKNLLTRSASTTVNEYESEESNISSEALSVQRAYFMDVGAISAICFTVFGICCTVGTIGIVLYRRRYLNKPQALSEPDSSVYIDDSTMRVSDNSDEMYSLDNDSFLNSLEAMTIQNYWTDTVKHTKL